MKRLGLVLAFVVALAGAAFAQGGMGPGPGTVHSTGGGVTCSSSQGNAFLARASAVTNNTDKTNYCALIDGLETDGVGCSNTLDVLYILAAPDSATYLLNLCSSSFSLTVNGTGTFTANQGWAGNGSTGFLNTGYAPSAGTFGNSVNAQIGAYVRTSRTADANTVAFGANGTGSIYAYIQPRQTSSVGWSVNGTNAQFPTFANSNAQGSWSGVRTNSTQSSIYLNGSSTALTTSNNFQSGAVVDFSLYIGAQHNAGAGAAQFSTDQIAAAWFGASTSAANALAIRTRINTFMTAYGTNVY